jgi:hypothetical protein
VDIGNLLFPFLSVLQKKEIRNRESISISKTVGIMVSIVISNIAVCNIDEFGQCAEREGFEPSVNKKPT